MIKNNLPVQRESNREELIKFIIEGIHEVKGHEIVDIELNTIQNSICDDFIICHGTSKRQVDAIADSVEKTVRENTKLKPWHKEGFQNAEWILLDYVDVVVHIFNEQNRKFYNLEGLWADAKINYIDQKNESIK
ncbi:MAG: ribosome silencing factor [Bacteroidales bacterium]|nr:ribosome silencing factor [Bacteroidales bacterium]